VACRGTVEIRRWFWKGDLREIVILEGLGFEGSIILKWVTNKWYGDMD